MAFSKSGDKPATTSARVKNETTRPNWFYARKQKSDRSTLKAEDVLANTDIVSLIGEYVELRPRGKEMLGLCPFHEDSKPSFEVNGAKGIYSCWSCSAGLNGSRGGDALTFVQRYHGMSFVEALNYLAKRAGMQVPEGSKIGTPKANPHPRFVPRSDLFEQKNTNRKEINLNADKGPLYQMMQVAQDLFSSELSASPEIIKYLTQDRGINPALLGKYRIGYAPDSFGRLRSKVSDYDTSEALFDAGLVKINSKGRRYDFFRNRLTFAVRDDAGQIVAFGGRRIGDSVKMDAQGKEIPVAKYLNSPETAIFNKREVLFGWYEAKEHIADSGYVLMVEGYMDVLSLASHDVMNAAACMGTSLTEHHIEKILGQVRRIVFCFDGDEAGQQAGFRSLSALFPHLENDVEVSFLTLPDGLDPDEYIRRHGKKAFLAQVSGADTLAVYWERTLKRLYPDAANKDRLWENAKDLVKLLPADSKHSQGLLQVAAMLTGRRLRSQHKSAPAAPSARAQCNGLSSFVANDPSDRLYLAVTRLPHIAAQVRPLLIDQQRGLDQALLPYLADWQRRFDQAMAAGFTSSASNMTPLEQRQNEVVINAAPSILSQYLAHKEREILTKALEAGELDEQDYLSKLRYSTFARPR